MRVTDKQLLTLYAIALGYDDEVALPHGIYRSLVIRGLIDGQGHLTEQGWHTVAVHNRMNVMAMLTGQL